MRSTFVGGLLVEGVDDPDDIVSHVSIDIAGPASETHSGEEGASPCAASASDATGKSVVTAEDLVVVDRLEHLRHPDRAAGAVVHPDGDLLPGDERGDARRR